METDVTGRVLDSRGAPVPGVTVTITSHPVTTTTDAAGRFSARVEVGDHMLTVKVGNVSYAQMAFQAEAGTPAALGDIPPTDPFYPWYPDGDGDGHGVPSDPVATAEDTGPPPGYAAAYDDCNDAVDTIHPGAPEICNDIDDSCDGQVDEELPLFTYHADGDGDGFGHPTDTTDACALPPGYVDDNTDCDDMNAAVYPGAAEVCNGMDDSCDGQVDEGLATTSFYRDADGDGYGNPGVMMDACGPPDGYVADANDCDDTDARLNPETLWYADGDGDGYPGEAEPVAACVAPSPGHVADFQVTVFDCDDGNGAVHPGAAEVPDNGVDDDCNPSTPDTAAFDQAELAGAYNVHFMSPTDFSTLMVPRWGAGAREIGPGGNLLRESLTHSDGTDTVTYGPEVLTLGATGAVTSSADILLRGAMGIDGNTLAAVTDAEDGAPTLLLLTRKGAGFVPADLTGAWLVHDLIPEFLQWRRGPLVVEADGRAAGTFEYSATGAILPAAGAVLIDTGGGVTLLLDDDTAPATLSADGDVMVATYTGGGFSTPDHLTVAVRWGGATYATADLAGQWSFHALGTGGNLWGGTFNTRGHGTIDVAPDGTAQVLFQSWRDTVAEQPVGPIYTKTLWRRPAAALPDGVFAVDALGVVSHGALPSFDGAVSSNRNVMVATYLTPDNAPVLLFAQRRRAAPAAALTAEAANAVSALVDQTGGTLQTTAADGTVYHLEVPPGALEFPGATLTLAPTASASGALPAGGILGAAQLGPEGQHFGKPVTLTITPSGGAPAEVLGFTHAGSGTDRFEFQGTTAAGGEIRMELSHFSGAAAVPGGPAGQADPDQGFADALNHAVNMAILRQSDAESIAAVRKAAQDWTEQSILPTLNSALLPEELFGALEGLLDIGIAAQLLGLDACDSLGSFLAAELSPALNNAAARVTGNLEAACLSAPPGCERLELLREFLRFQARLQQLPTGGCMAVTVLDQAAIESFCDQAMSTLPVRVDVMPPATAVTEGGMVSLSAIASNGLGAPLPGETMIWEAGGGGSPVATVDQDGTVTGLSTGQETVRASVFGYSACVDDAATVYVSPEVDGVYTVTTTERIVGTTRPECHTADITTPPGPYNVKISVGSADPFKPRSLQVVWSDVAGVSGFMYGHLTGGALRVGGLIPGSPDVDRDCKLVFGARDSGSGSCEWERKDIDFCFGVDEITLTYEGPAP